MDRIPLFLRLASLWLAGIGIVWAQQPVPTATRLAVEADAYSPPGIDGSRTVKLRVRSTDDAGLTVADRRTNATLHAYTFRSATVVVSEIARDFQEIEFTNTGEETLDLANWSLRAGQRNLVRDSYRVIAGPALLPPGGVFRWSSRTNFSGTFPELSESSLLARDGLSVIELRNAAGELVDQVVLFVPGPVTEVGWVGPGVSAGNNVTNTMSRNGNQNRFQALDWTFGPPSLGLVNPRLNLPWNGARQAALPQPIGIVLTNGVWEGVVSVPAGNSRRIQWAAGFGDGRLWDGQVATVPAAPALGLELESGSTRGTEAAPGPVAVVRVRLPDASVTNTERRIALAWSAPGEFSSPTEVVIPAGANGTSFPVEALDDLVADGRSRVRLTARLAGFAPAEMEFTLDDNESGSLRLSLPSSAPEGAIRLEEPSWVSLAAPALHDTEVELVGEGRLRPTARVIIPAGAQSARFDLRVLTDPFNNLPPAEDRIRATTSGWPPAVAALAVVDDEFRGFALQAPQQVVEGIPRSAQVRFYAPFDRPVLLRITSSPPALEHPAQMTVPAGTSVVDIPLSRPDDHVASPPVVVLLTVQADGIDLQTASVGVIDNDFPAERLLLAIEPAVFSTGPARFILGLADSQSALMAVDGVVQLRVVPGVGNAALAPGSTSVSLVNGSFDGPIQFTGSGPAVVLEAVFGGITNRSSPFDLTPGRIVAEAIADVARWPGTSNLLALRFLTNGAAVSGQLVELDPRLGTVVRQLDLPKPAERIAVADNGAVAWLGSVSNSLQRIDLAAWKVDRELTLSLAPGGEARLPRAIAISPGSTDDLVAMTFPPRLGAEDGVRLVAVRAGETIPVELLLDPGGYGPDVISGRFAGELYAICSKVLYRIVLGDAGFLVAAKRDFLTLPVAYVTHPVVTNDGLLLASGQVLNPETLEDLPDYAPGTGFPYRTAAASFPELNLTVFASESYNLVTYDAVSRTEVARRLLPPLAQGQAIDRLVRYGSRGLAALSWGERRLVLVDEAPRQPAVADLAVGIVAPTELVRLPEPNRIAQVDATLSVTNHGPDVASDVFLMYAPFQELPLGTLQPGEVRVIPWSYSTDAVGRLAFPVSIRSSASDPVPGNNSATNETVVLPPPFPSQMAVDLPARHLVSSPDGKELWLAVGLEAAPAGIAVLDPDTGVRLRTLPVGTDPRRMAFTPDNRAVYIQLGTNRLVRWNLDTSALDFEREFTGDTVVDFVSLPEPRGRLAVLNRAKLTILEGNSVVQNITLPAATQRAVGVQGGRLWVAWQDNLRAYRINAGNLTADITRSVYVPSGNYRFAVEGDQLFFDGRIVNVNGGERSPTFNSGIPWIPAGEFAYNALAGVLRRHRMSDLNSDAEAGVPGLDLAGALLDQVRFGTNGFAFRTERGLLFSARSPLVRSGTGDLAVSIEALEPAYYNQPVAIRLVVTNRGPDAVELSQLKVRIDGGTATTVSGRPAFLVDNTIVIPGDALPAGGSYSVTLKTTPSRFPFSTESLTLQASVIGSATDPTPGDAIDSRTLITSHVAADVAVLVAMPPPSGAAESVLRCVVTNRGPGVVLRPGIVFEPSTGLSLLSVDRGTLVSDCCGARTIRNLVPSLAAGESVVVNLVVGNAGPGIYPYGVHPDFITTDPRPSDNIALGVIQVPRADGPALYPGFRLPFSDVQWMPARSEWVVSDNRALYRLAPVTLDVRGSFKLPYDNAEFHLTDDGGSVWVATDTREARRFALDTGELEQTLNSTHNLTFGSGILIPLPGRPGIVVVAGLDDLGQMAVIAYDQGVALPVRYTDDLQWLGRRLEGVGAPGGLVYFSNGGQLRELELRADGLYLRRNLDAFNRSIDYRMAVADGLLIQGFEGVLDLESLNLLPIGTFARPSPGGVGYQSIYKDPTESVLRVYDLPTRQLRWQTSLRDFNGLVGAGGPAGALLLGNNGGWLPTPPNPGVDLQVGATLQSPPLGIAQDFTVDLMLRQSGVWQARGTRLTVDLPAGLELVSPAASGLDRQLVLPDFEKLTTLPVVFRGTSPGAYAITFRMSSADPDPSPDDAVATVAVAIPEAPVLVLTDQEVSDNGRPLVFRLSTRAPHPLRVRLQAELIDAQEEDLTALTYDLEFPMGVREAEAGWIAFDNRLEPDERFRIRMLSGDLVGSPESAVVTIVDRDRVAVQAASVSRVEGNTNGSTVEIVLQLAEAAAMPVELGFRTLDGTAVAGDDYQPVSGHLYFAPGQRTNRISIPIVGDLRFEANEAFNVDLFDGLGVLLPATLPTVTLRNDDVPASPQAVIERDPVGEISVTFPSEVGVVYSLQSRTNLVLGNWERASPFVPGTGGPLTLRPGAGLGPLLFYRLQAN